MRRFKWIEWNLQKIDAHALSADDLHESDTPMTVPSPDTRSPERRARDEQIASESPFAPPDLSADAVASPVEAHLGTRRRPVAVAGVVENGLVRPLDPNVKLPERARVIIVASEAS